MNSEKASYNAGKAAGETKEKASNVMDKASDVAHSAMDSISETGQQMKAKAQGAADAVKDAVNKN